MMLMTTRRLQNKRAHDNGKIGEKYAAIVYDTAISVNALIDGEYRGNPLEVKTCQVRITDNSHNNRTRRGRYYLTKEQHEFLIQNNGYYAFVLLDDDQGVIFSRLIKANDLYIPRKSCQLIWTRIFKEFADL